MTDKLLFVDDEPNLLDGIKRQLRNKFTIETAIGAAEGLTALHSRGPFAVVISDMRMPDMSGVDFLKEVKVVSPSSVRMMLTGNGDQETAAIAVNQGNIFRFLSKPCETEQLTKALNDALEQYSLVVAEREILESTLTGSVKIFSELLSMTNPTLFSDGARAREQVRAFAERLNIADVWELEIASMLAYIGFITIPEEIVAKHVSGSYLSTEEMRLIDEVPQAGAKLLANIPRLEKVANIVAHSRKSFDGTGRPSGEALPLGSRILRIVMDFNTFSRDRAPLSQALRNLQKNKSEYDPTLLRQFIEQFAPAKEQVDQEGTVSISPAELLVGQTICCDISTKDGILLLKAGAKLSETSVERLKNYSKLFGLQAPILVDSRVPVKM
jgi:response regulator RpfG family c-di-GMP phosphodiesterase